MAPYACDPSKTTIILPPISHRVPAIVSRLSLPYSCGLPYKRLAAAPRPALPCRRCARCPVDCVSGVSYSVAVGSGEDRTDDILQTLQPVGTHQTDLLLTLFLQLCEHLAPAQGSLRRLVEDPQHLAPLVFTYDEHYIENFSSHTPLAVDLHVYAIEKTIGQ